MKNCVGMWVAVIFSGLVACGGTEAVETPLAEEMLGEESSALVTCSASCPDGSTVSCTGATCSATEGSHVECDGFRNICVNFPPLCTSTNRCSRLAGLPCSPVGASRSCCLPGHPNPNCFCTIQGVWACSAL